MNPNTADEIKITENKAQKMCFIIMPIAHHPDYPDGHFDRVYEYIIKPACRLAGMEPYRADDNEASDMIMLDILNRLVECDMALCDISSKNANVFFELGLRQAFNKKTILITDGLQSAPFDISSLRHIQYSPSLRVDTVSTEVPRIASMLSSTESLPDEKVNSIVQLLKIKPAKVEEKELAPIDSAVYNMFLHLQNQIKEIASSSRGISLTNSKYSISSPRRKIPLDVPEGTSFSEVYSLIDTHSIQGDWVQYYTPKDSDEIKHYRLGRFITYDNGMLLFNNHEQGMYHIDDSVTNKESIKRLNK